jgi:hypothetical protein
MAHGRPVVSLVELDLCIKDLDRVRAKRFFLSLHAAC